MKEKINADIQALSSELNRAVIKYRGVYSAWSKNHGVSYNEMLVMYTVQDNGYCTQKQISESYLLPKQTVNNVFVSMIKNGLLTESPEHNVGREKAYVLTQKGIETAAPLLSSIGEVEKRAALSMGIRKLEQLTALMTEYDELLKKALEESESNN